MRVPAAHQTSLTGGGWVWEYRLPTCFPPAPLGAVGLTTNRDTSPGSCSAFSAPTSEGRDGYLFCGLARVVVKAPHSTLLTGAEMGHPFFFCDIYLAGFKWLSKTFCLDKLTFPSCLARVRIFWLHVSVSFSVLLLPVLLVFLGCCLLQFQFWDTCSKKKIQESPCHIIL